MIYIVHGENYAKSRALVINQQKKANLNNKTEVDITQITPQNLSDLAHSADLFGNPPFIILNVSSAGRMNVSKYINIIEKIPSKTTLIILSSKSLSSRNEFIKNAKALKVKVINNEKEIGSNVFKFSDAVFNKQRARAYQELQKLIQEEVDWFSIFSGLLYGLRNLGLCVFEAPSFKSAKPFVQSKTRNIAVKYSPDKTIGLYAAFFEIDKKAKLGEITPDMMVTLAVEKVLNS